MSREKITTSDYAICFLSFIPLIGVILGIISIILGFSKKSRLLIIVGFLGITSTVVLYGSLFYWGFKSENSYDNWNVFTENNLNKTFIYIEFYKTQNGEYPDSLGCLRQYDVFLQLTDTPNFIDFHYQKSSDSTYSLLGVGKDKNVFTDDDLYPTLAENSLKQNGLIKR